MSVTLAIASASALLKQLLENELADPNVTTSIGSDIVVSVLPPDRIATGQDERAQLNIFLHQISTNTSLSLPHRSDTQQTDKRLSVKDSTVELYYVLTAYGAAELQIELLLDYATHVMSTVLVIDQEAIQRTLQAIGSAAHSSAPLKTVAELATSRSGAHIKRMVISPQYFTTQELATLWSALQTRYRPSIIYKVSLTISS